MTLNVRKFKWKFSHNCVLQNLHFGMLLHYSTCYGRNDLLITYSWWQQSNEIPGVQPTTSESWSKLFWSDNLTHCIDWFSRMKSHQISTFPKRGIRITMNVSLFFYKFSLPKQMSFKLAMQVVALYSIMPKKSFIWYNLEFVLNYQSNS